MLVRIPKYENFVNKVDFDPGSENLYSGNVSSGTTATLTDTSANWEVNQWKDKIVKIFREGDTDFEFAVVESNTADTLTFDDDLIFIPCSLCTYDILVTFVVEPYFLPILIAVNLETNNSGILLPKSTPQIERTSFHAYIEMSLNGNNRCPVMCRGAERQAEAKYGLLEHKSEGVKLYPHQWMRPHWDIIDTFNIKRLASGYFSQPELITTANNVWGVVGDEGTLVYDNKKRFTEVIRESKVWLRYTSLLVRTFRTTIDLVISKTGGGQGEFHLSGAKRDGETGDITYFYLDNRLAKTRFGGQDGIQDININIPMELKRNDEIAILGLKTASTMTVSSGTIGIIEF